MYRIKRDRRATGDMSEWHDASLSVSQNPPLLPMSEHSAKTTLKSAGPSIPLRSAIPPRDPDLSFLHPPPACRRGSHPRVSVCGQCTLLHEPRPFTEGPRNATALNNHPPKDRRPCTVREEAQENKPGIRIRWIARQENQRPATR